MKDKHTSFNIPTPTSEGNWHMIDGKLVDVPNASPAAAADAAPTEEVSEPQVDAKPAGRRQR